MSLEENLMKKTFTTREIAFCAMIAALEGRADAIILTGGLAYSVRFTGAIKQRVDRLAKVFTYPGEDEMSALAMGAPFGAGAKLRILEKIPQ